MKKKLICALLAGLMILSLAACGKSGDNAAAEGAGKAAGGSKTELYDKYSHLIDRLEEGNYDEALSIVNGMRAEARRQADENADDQPVMDVICGTFKSPDESFVLEIKDDYTVQYDGSSHLYMLERLTDTLESVNAKKDFSIPYEVKADSYNPIQFRYNEVIDDYVLGFWPDDKSYLELFREDKLESVKAPVMEVLCGKFSTLDGSSTLTVNDDSTFELNGQSYNYILSNILDLLSAIESKEFIYISYKASDDTNNSFNLQYNDRIGDYYISLYNDEKTLTMFREGCITPIEITMDNYDQYFEFSDYLDYRTNSFGEISNVYIGSVFRSKDGLNIYSGEAAVEVSYVSREVAVISYDTESKTFELGEETERSKGWPHDPYSFTTTLYTVYDYDTDPPELRYVGANLYSDTVNTESNTVYSYDYTLTRIQGTLYMIGKP